MTQPSPTPPPAWRRTAVVIRAVFTTLALVAVVLSLCGQVVRDRSVWLALLMYFPPLVITAGLVVLDLVFLGRCVPVGRFVLAGIGITLTFVAVPLHVSFGPGTATEPGLGIVQWNVHWGGGKHRSEETWNAIVGQIEARKPDVVVLSEAPEEASGWIAALAGRNDWETTACEHQPDSPYWYRLVVAARPPVRRLFDKPVTHGHVMAVELRLDDRPVRLLVVDGESDPRLSRPAFLADMDAVCRAAESAGTPFDILAGDFNTPRRSIGFDEIRSRYDLASDSAFGWRGTYPAEVPFLDIDHVWLRRERWTVIGAGFFGSPASDHRGLDVRFVARGHE